MLSRRRPPPLPAAVGRCLSSHRRALSRHIPPLVRLILVGNNGRNGLCIPNKNVLHGNRDHLVRISTNLKELGENLSGDDDTVAVICSNSLARPRTLLIDSEQLESGDALDKNFREMASDEIDRFRREIVERTGDRRQAEKITDQDLLREVMNTVGKIGRLGDSIRCVVSVSMLTEGWDANTVTHVLGVRAFGTQLLCEQVIGRGLRRQSYDLNEKNRFNVEYADVLGIPFDFTDKPVVAQPHPPRETINVRAIRPDRDELEIRFPRVVGYRVELPEERLTGDFNDDSVLEITPELVGASETLNSGIIGEAVDLNLVHTGDVRPSQVVYELTSHLLLTKWRDANGDPLLHLFGQLKRTVRQWLDGFLVCKGKTYPAQLKYKMIADIRPGTPIYRSLERLARDDVSTENSLLVLRTPKNTDFQCPAQWRLDRVIDLKTMEVHLFDKAPQDEPNGELGK